MDLTYVLIIIIILYFLYQYTPLHCMLNPLGCIKDDVNNVKSFFGDLFDGIRTNTKL
jgi:hypothetical protein